MNKEDIEARQEFVAKLYLAGNTTMKEIGQGLGVSRQMIHKIIKKYEERTGVKVVGKKDYNHKPFLEYELIDNDKLFTGKSFSSTQELCDYLDIDRRAYFIREGVKKGGMRVSRGDRNYLYLQNN
jgi:biotin operon repressor